MSKANTKKATAKRTAKKATAKKAATTAPATKKPTRKEMAERWRSAARELIASAKHTRPQIIAAVVESNPHVKEITVATFLSDAQNEKYYAKFCKNERLATTDKKTKIISWK